MDAVGVIEVPVVHIFFLGKSEYFCQGSVQPPVGPQLVLLHKSGHPVFLICDKLHVLVRNAQINAVVLQHAVLRIENLVCGALQVQQVNTAVRVPHPVGFVHVVKLRLTGIRQGRDPVVHGQGGGILVDLPDAGRGLIVNLGIQISPGQLVHAVVNVHAGQGLLLCICQDRSR